MTKLYELARDYRELQDMQGVPDDAIADTLDGIEGALTEKAQGIMSVARELETDVESIDAEIARLREWKAVLVNRELRLREYLRYNMRESGITNIKCPLFSITLAKGREVVEILDAEELPDEYVSVVTSVKPDKAAILKALKAGEDVPGARLSMSGESLRVK